MGKVVYLSLSPSQGSNPRRSPQVQFPLKRNAGHRLKKVNSSRFVVRECPSTILQRLSIGRYAVSPKSTTNSCRLVLPVRRRRVRPPSLLRRWRSVRLVPSLVPRPIFGRGSRKGLDTELLGRNVSRRGMKKSGIGNDCGFMSVVNRVWIEFRGLNFSTSDSDSDPQRSESEAEPMLVPHGSGSTRSKHFWLLIFEALPPIKRGYYRSPFQTQSYIPIPEAFGEITKILEIIIPREQRDPNGHNPPPSWSGFGGTAILHQQTNSRLNSILITYDTIVRRGLCTLQCNILTNRS